MFKTKTRHNTLRLIAVSVLSILLAGVAFFASSVPMAYAGSVDLTSIKVPSSGAVTAECDKDSAWKVSGATLTGTIAASSSTSCGKTTYTAQNTTLTFKNSSGANATLSFDYTLGLNSGSCTIAGANKTASGSYKSSTLSADAEVKVKITSNKANSTATTISITGINLEVEVVTVTTYFDAPTGGYYSISSDGFSQTLLPNGDTKSHEQSSEKNYTATAYPDDEHSFVGWTLNNTVISTENPYVFGQASSNAHFNAKFVIKGAAKFQANGKEFYDLNDANAAALNASPKTIRLVASGIVPEGTYTISSGVTLFLPTSATDTTIRTTKPESTTGTTAPTEYLRLTLKPGAVINVSGAVSIPSLLCRANGSEKTGSPVGPSSRIFMESTSVMNFQSGANLYCWGYIYGSGEVHMLNGSNVYEMFQLPCWKGGTVMSNILDTCKSNRVFPLNSYYVQNIEASLYVHYGATETVYVQTTVSILSPEASVVFISKNSGMFRITDSAGYVMKRYNADTDRLEIEIHGNANISSFSVTMYITINTADFVLPINTNMTIRVASGTTSLLAQDISFLPASQLIIDEGASFSIASGSHVYFYSYNASNWGTYTSISATPTKISPIKYTASNGTCPNSGYANKRTITNYTSSKIDIGGSLEVNGGIYSTVFYTSDVASVDVGDAPIFSLHGKGQISITSTSLSNSHVLRELKSKEGDFDVITYRPALLKNGENYSGDKTVQVTARGKYTYTLDSGHTTDYSYGFWKTGSLDKKDVTFSFVDTEGTVLHSETVTEDDSFVLPAASATWLPASEYTLKGWTLNRSVYRAGESIKITLDFDGAELVVFYGGWFQSLYYPRERSTLSAVKNSLYRIPDYETSTLINLTIQVNPADVCLFGANGELVTNDPTDTSITSPSDWAFYYDSSKYLLGDDQIYHLITGILQTDEGLVKIGDDYYYFGNDHCAYKNGRFYIDSSNPALPSGYYYFDSLGKMETGSAGTTLPTAIENGYAYFFDSDEVQHLAKDWGLFALDGYLYYALPDGSIVHDTATPSYTTFYVTKTNGCSAGGQPINEGLYYFDPSGHMCDAGLSIIANGRNAS